MKITKKYLKKLILEELTKETQEGDGISQLATAPNAPISVGVDGSISLEVVVEGRPEKLFGQLSPESVELLQDMGVLTPDVYQKDAERRPERFNMAPK